MRVLFWPNKYNNILELGRGVSGVVYKASEKETGQIVAIKLVDMNKSKISQEQIQGEIRALLILNPENQRSHINIIKLIECFIHKTTAIFVLEYVDGGTLEDFMYSFERGMPISVVSHCLYQIVNAIEYMNSRKCSHRDIKPANILMLRNRNPPPPQLVDNNEDSYVIKSDSNSNHYRYDPNELPILKVTDYGYSSINREENELHSTLAGSPLYMAPEIIHIILSPYLEPGTGKLSPESNEGYNPLLVDIWAIGAMTFRLVTGDDLINVIFPNLNQTTVLAALVNLAKMIDSGEFQRGLDRIPNEISKYNIENSDQAISFITSLLQLDPKKRLTLKEALAHPFLAAGKESFTRTLNEHYKENKDLVNSIIPSDLVDFINNNNASSSSSSPTYSPNNSEEHLPTYQQQQAQQEQLQKQLEVQQKQEQPQDQKNSSQQPEQQDQASSQQQLQQQQEPLSPPQKVHYRWSSTLPRKKLSKSLAFLSHQRSENFKLFPKLLPPPTASTPPYETMTWRSPPIPTEDSITWTTITQDAIFTVQFGVLTSLLKAISVSEEYQYRIISASTNPPLEIGVSNYRDSILYMYHIVKTIIAPQLISLSLFDDNSTRSVLAAFLIQIKNEFEQEEVSRGWTVLDSNN
ncbi:hypothetical protein DICPUDRAFT_96861 [Dictyostelium purpureum]|uniref:Protein kinase domain-containing protein n=1 Tax=Dictyostelium purpureum TaxID=5786 RepID=F0ZBU2_DICPU|nr:uncharacterized protein DICPUDRAFT_96861 [Dictyostelium purpureum]EGC38599.1 hypothetical protein DICPUDRAFT_96861 [Dictyostelium purpureum]|eukprot:XP_003284878.1 hypothetical protein DICPUDRAFT_96861 [Dictyostelium purpureum]